MGVFHNSLRGIPPINGILIQQLWGCNPGADTGGCCNGYNENVNISNP
jgi:hypothetical protein